MRRPSQASVGSVSADVSGVYRGLHMVEVSEVEPYLEVMVDFPEIYG